MKAKTVKEYVSEPIYYVLKHREQVLTKTGKIAQPSRSTYKVIMTMSVIDDDIKAVARKNGWRVWKFQETVCVNHSVCIEDNDPDWVL